MSWSLGSSCGHLPGVRQWPAIEHCFARLLELMSGACGYPALWVVKNHCQIPILITPDRGGSWEAPSVALNPQEALGCTNCVCGLQPPPLEPSDIQASCHSAAGMKKVSKHANLPCCAFFFFFFFSLWVINSNHCFISLFQFLKYNVNFTM